jgi:hypothetical protein
VVGLEVVVEVLVDEVEVPVEELLVVLVVLVVIVVVVLVLD